jgi:hypothetical protein
MFFEQQFEELVEDHGLPAPRAPRPTPLALL